MVVPIYLDNDCEPIKLNLFQAAQNAPFTILSGLNEYTYTNSRTVLIFYDGTPVTTCGADAIFFRQHGCAGNTLFKLNLNYIGLASTVVPTPDVPNVTFTSNTPASQIVTVTLTRSSCCTDAITVTDASTLPTGVTVTVPALPVTGNSFQFTVNYDGTYYINDTPFTIQLNLSCCDNPTLTMTGNQISKCPFAFNNCLDFDGVNDYVDLANNAAYAFGSNDFSVSLWVKFDVLPTVAIPQRFLSKSTAANDFGWRIGALNTGFSFGSLSAGGEQRVNHNVTLATGIWYHVVFVRVGTTASNWLVYVNGSSTGTTVALNTAIQNFTNTETINLGRSKFSGGRFFLNGKLDEIIIFNKALSSTEVAQLYDSGSGGCISTALLSSVVGLWLLDESLSPGGTNTADDSSATNNDGILTNFGTRTQTGSGDPAWVAH